MTYLLLLLLPISGAAARANPAPPFRVQEQHGIWQLVTPGGDPMFSLGVCCVNRGISREKYDAAKPGYAAWQEYRDPAAWANTTLRRLRSWGFTTIGGWSDDATLRASPRMDLAFTPVLHLGASCGAPWFDMWDPKVIQAMDAVAREQILPVRDDPRLLGYYTDNEMGWWNAALFKMTLQQPSTSGQRQRLVRMIRSHYRDDWGALLHDFVPEGAAGFSQLDQRGLLYLRPGGSGIRVMRQFLGMAARRYYQLVRQTIRRYDRRALILGDRYQSFYYPEVARAAAPYLDVVSTNLNANWNDGTFVRFYLDTLSALTRRPVMVSEFYLSARENRSGNPNSSSGFPVVDTQIERADGFRNTLVALRRLPFIIGADWFQYYDEPAGGREDGENYDMGLVDIHDTPYAEITAAAASVNLPPLKHPASARNADVSGGVPQAPAAPMAELRPMLILKNWDRERGFVKPASGVPLADLYLSWQPDAMYLGLYAIDTPEADYYRDKVIPERDRMEWTVRMGAQTDRIRVRLGAGRRPTVAGPGVTAVGMFIPGDVRCAAVMRTPAARWGKMKLGAGERLRFSSTLWTHARAYRVDWTGRFTLANDPAHSR